MCGSIIPFFVLIELGNETDFVEKVNETDSV